MTSDLLTVTELNRSARRLIEQRFPLLWIVGEVSNLTRAASGHLYFTLKDAQAQVRCAMFRSRAQRLSWSLDNGQQVEVQALVTLYEARGDFQLTVEAIRRGGMGRLYELFIKLRDQLAAEGLFAPERKRALPRYPRRVGLITSPQAAALADVVAAFRRRAPQVELIVYPSLVQGSVAPSSLVAALDQAYARSECELLLLVRGGGSLEDLWAFNDEHVVRRLAVAPAPTITGVGHETDVTLVDYVADQRAATPTAAAELASAGWHAARTKTDALAAALHDAMQTLLENRMQALDRLALRLMHPAQRLAASRQRLDRIALRLGHAMHARLAALPRLDRLEHRLRHSVSDHLAQRRLQLARCQGALAALSPLATLERGYSIVRSADGAIVRAASALTPGQTLDMQFGKGQAQARVERITPGGDL